MKSGKTANSSSSTTSPRTKITAITPTPAKYGFQSYLSVPITLANGQFFGTLCAIDPRPAKIDRPEIIAMFKLFADLIAMHLDAQNRIATSERALQNERETAHLREQFIAVLGHDLRNPLAAITNSAHTLRNMPQSDDARKVIAIVHRSAARAIELVSDVLDFARHRLGGGLAFNLIVDARLQSALAHVISELQAAWPSREIQQEFSEIGPVFCDARRLGQMLSNLVANALAHGDSGSPVFVRGSVWKETFELSVANFGPTIPLSVMEKLFHPFTRGLVRPGQEGLGLGLYIAAQIAAGHKGTLDVTSSDGRTCFTFRMPVRADHA